MVAMFIIVYLQRTFHVMYQISTHSGRKQKKILLNLHFFYFTFGNKLALTGLSIFKDVSLYIIGASVVPTLLLPISRVKNGLSSLFGVILYPFPSGKKPGFFVFQDIREDTSLSWMVTIFGI